MDIRSLSDKELKKAIHTYGKRAMSRLRTLEKAYSKGGKLYGDKSYILERYGDYNTVVKGKSRKALELSLYNALQILGSKSSTVKGVMQAKKERFDTFKKNHPNIGRQNTDDKLDRDKYEKAMRILGKLQAAEKGTNYDSDEQVFTAFQLAKMRPDKVDKFLEDVMNGDTSSSEFFEDYDIDYTSTFEPLEDDSENPFDNEDDN